MTIAAGTMRIAVNASILGERPTGLGIYTSNLVRELSQLLPGMIVYTSAPGALGAEPGQVRRVSPMVRPERRMLGHGLRIAWLGTRLPARLRREGVGLLLNTVPEGCMTAGIPQVTVVHDLLPLLYPEEYPRQQYYFRWLVRRVLWLSRLVIADSESTRRDIVSAYGLPEDRLRVVPAGYDKRVFHPGRTAETAHDPGRLPYILFVGNLLPHKNILRLLDAFSLVARRAPCRLIIRGEGHPTFIREISARIATLSSGRLVEVRSYALPEQLGELYRGARLLVLPSLSEGFGLTALEAMACGVPVIASNTSSVPEVVGDAGILVDPTDTVALGDAMYKVLTSEALRRELSARGLERARRFSWRRTALDVLAVLEEAAGTPG
jgi:glycosyltransferase involved in cell wall biosynthesis